MSFGEDGFFACALNFNEFEGFGHDDVEVDGGCLVFGVVEVEDGCVFVDACGDGSDEFFEREVFDFAFCHHAIEGDGGGDAGSGDGGGACAAVCLEDIAIDPEGALADFLEIYNGA